MKISRICFSSQNQYKNSKPQKTIVSQNINFGNKWDKIIEEIITAPNYRKVKIRFDEAIHLLQSLGFTIQERSANKGTRKTGSHFIAKKDKISINVIYPHGKDLMDTGFINDLKKYLISLQASASTNSIVSLA